jgi:hypothetical protein
VNTPNAPVVAQEAAVGRVEEEGIDVPLMLVAVAAPRTGAMKVGDVENTKFPLPVDPLGEAPPMEMLVPNVWTAVQVWGSPKNAGVSQAEPL